MNSKEKLIDSINECEQRIFIKFATLLGWSVSVTHKNLTSSIGNNRAYSKTTVKEWMRKFKQGIPSVEEQRGGDRNDRDLRNERIIRISREMNESRHWSLRSLANKLSIPKSVVQRIVKNDLLLTKKLGKWVPHNLNEYQKEHRILSCQANLALYNKDKSRLKRTITLDETWVSLYMSQDRSQSRVWVRQEEKPPIIVKDNIGKNKRMLIMSMDFNGIAFWDLLPEKTVVNAEFYRNYLDENIEKWMSGKSFRKPILLHDNAKPHTANVVKEFLKNKEISTWFQPAYSPDISPLDFNCFAQLKRKLKGIKHTNWEELIVCIGIAVDELNKSGLINGVQKLPYRWQRVINSDGEYL
jgi:[histone H3]-lysine36 N-dimethyltransferase SETMAR